jgi:hypothetical protein
MECETKADVAGVISVVVVVVNGEKSQSSVGVEGRGLSSHGAIAKSKSHSQIEVRK